MADFITSTHRKKWLLSIQDLVRLLGHLPVDLALKSWDMVSKMPCSWCPVDCIWVAIPVLPLICWKSFLECGIDLLWTDILSGVGLDSNIVMKYPPDIAHWFYLDAPETITYLSSSLNGLVHALCVTRKRLTWVCSVICACRMMLQRYQVPWESLVPVFT
jgi:hypothetical protein